MYILVEENLTDDRHFGYWGPFKTKEDANDFGNRRIALLSEEWEMDSFIMEQLHWSIKRLSETE